jgi:hypothetical protein
MARLPDPIELEISELAGIFDDTGNPAAAWRAFTLARQHNLPVPASIDAEIVRFAEAVTAPLENGKDTITAASVANAWGIAHGRKPAPELRNARRNIDIWIEYWELRRGGVDPDTALGRDDAIARLVLRYNKTPKLIEGILTAQFEKHGPNDPFAPPAFRET